MLDNVVAILGNGACDEGVDVETGIAPNEAAIVDVVAVAVVAVADVAVADVAVVLLLLLLLETDIFDCAGLKSVDNPAVALAGRLSLLPSLNCVNSGCNTIIPVWLLARR